MKWINEEAIGVLVNYYYPRAKWLQDNCNWGKFSYVGEESNQKINDDLMQKIDIYDCYTRNAAGFSNVLQDLKFMTDTPKWHHQNDDRRRIIEGYDTKSWDLKLGSMSICATESLAPARHSPVTMDIVTMQFSIGDIFVISKICKSIWHTQKVLANHCSRLLVTNHHLHVKASRV